MEHSLKHTISWAIHQILKFKGVYVVQTILFDYHEIKLKLSETKKENQTKPNQNNNNKNQKVPKLLEIKQSVWK